MTINLARHRMGARMEISSSLMKRWEEFPDTELFGWWWTFSCRLMKTVSD